MSGINDDRVGGEVTRKAFDRIECSVCRGERITFVWAKLKVASGYGPGWYTQSMRVAIACEGCSGRGYFKGRPVDA